MALQAEQALRTSLGYRIYQEYDAYTWEAPSELPVFSNVRFASENDNFTRILACLSHWDNLNEQSLRAAALAKCLVIYSHQQEAVSACLLNHSTQEIIQIATHEHHKRQGYAYRLIQGLPALYPQASFCLKVERKNHAAQRLYQKLGFKKDVSKCEVWMLKSLKKAPPLAAL